jgi:hypothetical protein
MSRRLQTSERLLPASRNPLENVCVLKVEILPYVQSKKTKQNYAKLYAKQLRRQESHVKSELELAGKIRGLVTIDRAAGENVGKKVLDQVVVCCGHPVLPEKHFYRYNT